MENKVIPAFQEKAEEYSNIALAINEHMENWTSLLGLGDWDFNTHFIPNYCVEDDGRRASIASSWAYQHATLRFYLPAMAEDTFEANEITVIHELTHCLVDPLSTKDTPEDKLEFTVVNLARVFYRLKHPVQKSS